MGQPFGAYILEERLGQGGMAEVFRARRIDENDGTRVCIKRILPSLAKAPGFANMLRDEASVSLRMRHANLVHAHELGDVNGVLFVAMELVEGTNLARIMAALREGREPFPVAHALHIARMMCRGLHFAHTARSDDGKALDVVHRDVSPDNVLVGNDGAVKVADFGIARATERITQTRTGAIKGKPQYMAPEQALGERCDHRVDQFATAIVLWEMLAGRTLFGRTEIVATLDAVDRCRIPPTRRNDLPTDIEVAIHRALARDPADRFADMAAFERALASHDARDVDVRPIVALAAGAQSARVASGARAIGVDAPNDDVTNAASRTLAGAPTAPAISVSSVFTSSRPAPVKAALSAPVNAPMIAPMNAPVNAPVVLHMTPVPSATPPRVIPRQARWAAGAGVGLMFAAVVFMVTVGDDPREGEIASSPVPAADARAATSAAPPAPSIQAVESKGRSAAKKEAADASLAPIPPALAVPPDVAAPPDVAKRVDVAKSVDDAKSVDVAKPVDVAKSVDVPSAVAPSVDDIVAQHRAALRACAPRGTKAKVRVRFTVGANGHADAVVVESRGDASDNVVNCMTAALSTWSFTGVHEATTTLTIP